MIKRKAKVISLKPEEIEVLDNLAKELGMTVSDLVRKWMLKTLNDPKLKKILVGLTSYNVRYITKENDPCRNTHEPSAVSSNCLSNSNQETTDNQPYDPYENMTPEQLAAEVDRMMRELYPEDYHG